MQTSIGVGVLEIGQIIQTKIRPLDRDLGDWGKWWTNGGIGRMGCKWLKHGHISRVSI